MCSLCVYEWLTRKRIEWNCIAIPVHNNTLLHTPHNPKLQRSSCITSLFFFSAAYSLFNVCLSLYSLFAVDAFHNTFALIFFKYYADVSFAAANIVALFSAIYNAIQSRPSKNILRTAFAVFLVDWLVIGKPWIVLLCCFFLCVAWLPLMDWSL